MSGKVRRLLDWIDARFPLSAFWEKHVAGYYVPKKLNFWYLFGFLMLLALALQVLSGIWLAMIYKPDATLLPGTQTSVALASIRHFMEHVPGGKAIRYMHTTGTSLLFALMYLHIFRGLLYGSYKKPRELLWLLGMVLFWLMMMEAFFGQVLPWGQMSYWSTQVVMHLFESIPFIGKALADFLRGDYTVSGITLNRFFALHVVAVPLMLLLLVKLHLVALHAVGSTSPDGKEIREEVDLLTGKPADGVPLLSHAMHHLIAAAVFLAIFYALVCFAPALGGYFVDELNAVPADPYSTPAELRPMWYFAPFYAMLRAVPAWGGTQIWGAITITAAVLLPALLPWLDRSPVKSIRLRGWQYRAGVIVLAGCFVGLGVAGLMPPLDFVLGLSRLLTGGYFVFLIIHFFDDRA
ncbi:ubiquinol-cytochrome c reductase cytochrome b subunit [Formivibrio citricus]|uniref:Cytochrome b n=1 Tax=Formivibrio citricus TaxID=83765 RepID=A0A1I4XV17_9NEIS|nr:cytochrome bc complex cytochrome b subunit [Formivibrio citricus]SFN29664.1 ubiquinol-cytochrome c reductase cytochrome b subunit [Formivibrio citricus]